MSSTTSSAFTRAAVKAMRDLYPEELADKSFDNTGLLLEATEESSIKAGAQNKVLLTIDLTTAVADEAIEKKVSLVVAYHPIIFRPLKSVTLANTQQRSLLRLAAAGISVYCPHTAVDAASRGNAAWLASLVTEHTQVSSEGFAPAQTALSQGFCVNEDNYVSHGFPAAHIRELQPSRGTLPAFEISAIIPSGRPNASPSGPQAEGMGRLITFNTPVFAGSLLAHLAAELGRPQAFNVAVPYFGQPRSSTDAEKLLVQRIGVCAGSGGSVVSKAQPPADMIITGEMSHHELLACTENGQMVVCLAHSNSERGFLRQIMMPDLKTALGAQNAEVLVSERDADPLTTYVKRS